MRGARRRVTRPTQCRNIALGPLCGDIWCGTVIGRRCAFFRQRRSEMYYSERREYLAKVTVANLTIPELIDFGRFAWRNPTSSPVRTASGHARQLVTLIGGLLIAGAVFAQAAVSQAPARASSGELEEIVVTAEGREERLQDVPISISAFSQEKLEAMGLRSIDDLTRLTPGVTFSRNGTGPAGNYNDEGSDINIRGIDSTAGTSTTGIYLDDTPIQSRHLSFGTLNAFPSLIDLTRVEVLRGPQGTLFGAGSEGGAVRFITPQPGLRDHSGYLHFELAGTQSGDPSYELSVAGGGPIIDNTLGYRVSASFRKDSGWVDRVDP